ncbi:hypothetical protein DH09_01655 [Bacillaceae bacterium JMAK1]|nr:hypothetical protein DH09_01655 [Bacillaceae bacterium JMAK1]
MLVVGYGRLGQAIVGILTNHQTERVHVYNRTKDKLTGDHNVNIIDPQSFKDYHDVLLAIPAHAYEPFFSMYRSFFSSTCRFYYTATALLHSDVHTLLEREQTMIPCKLLGHARVALQEREAVFALQNDQQVKRFNELTSHAFTVIEGDEDAVRMANTIATEESLRGLMRMEERVSGTSISNEMLRAVQAQIPNGIAKAHLHHDHGHFARSLLQQWNIRGDEDE